MSWHLLIGGFIGLLGLCVGSFLNVVIYRLPQGLALGRPRWSFCPVCYRGISWYDNIPLLSWLLLRGRCRWCRSAVSLQYPLVEALTGLGFVLVYHLLAVAPAHASIGVFVWPQDGPLLAAWLVLLAALIVCTATDLVSYSIDIRVTDFALYAGIVLLALWPGASVEARWLASPLAAGVVACGVTAAVLLWRQSREAAPDPAPPGGADDAHARSHEADSPAEPPPVGPSANAPATGTPPVNAAPGTPPDFAARVLVGVGLIAASAIAAVCLLIPGVPGVVPVTLGLALAVVVLAGGHSRDADHEIAEAIAEEQPLARRMALNELGWLMIPLVVGGLACALLRLWPLAAAGWEGLIAWSPAGGLQPAAGAASAVVGAVMGAAAGWMLRIGFTLLLGREAFGTGDIYILAAAGAVAGGSMAVVGLLLAVVIALLGWLVGLVLKRSAMIPFGPWLLLGFLSALWLDRPVRAAWAGYREHIRFAWEQRPDMLLLGGGVLLVGVVLALVVARLVRRALERV